MCAPGGQLALRDWWGRSPIARASARSSVCNFIAPIFSSTHRSTGQPERSGAEALLDRISACKSAFRHMKAESTGRIGSAQVDRLALETSSHQRAIGLLVHRLTPSLFLCVLDTRHPPLSVALRALQSRPSYSSVNIWPIAPTPR